jgi:cysteinyl-tRNA synthetase
LLQLLHAGNANNIHSKADNFSQYYLQDPKDSNAKAFLESLSSSDGEKLDRLLRELHIVRQNRNYEQGDRITAEIKCQFNVRVYNDPPVWTTQKGVAPDSYLRRKERKISNQMVQEFGPQGHPYRQVVGTDIDAITCPLSFREINALLAQEARYRSGGRHEEADAIQFELTINGVQRNDDEYQWRADGVDTTWATATDDNNEDLGDIQPLDETRYTQQRSRHSTEEQRTQLQRIEQLVQYRSEAIVRRDIRLADFIALELFRTYGVVVDDVSRTWSFEARDPSQRNTACTTITTLANGEFEDDYSVESTLRSKNLVPPVLFGWKGHHQHRVDSAYRPVNIHAFSTPDINTLERIKDLLHERSEKRGETKLLEADAIRKELWHTYHVGISDRLRQWSVGGTFDDC